MADKAKGCVKLRRCSKLKSYYSAQYMQTERNKTRRMRRHLKRHPNDKQTAARLAA
jgi:hypothetical protein